MAEDKVTCRAPRTGRDGVTAIAAWAFGLDRRHRLDGLSGESRVRGTVRDGIGRRLTENEAERPGMLAWHVMTVKLELEVRGEFARVACKGPQQTRLAT